MRNFIKIIPVLFCISLFGCSFLTSKPTENISFGFHLGDAEQKPDYLEELKDYSIYEWVTKGESIDNWIELVTIENFTLTPYLPKAPEDMMNVTKAKIKKRCPNVKWNIIKNQNKSILYEWRIQGCPSEPDQNEIGRFVDGNWNRWRIAFAAKGKELSKDKREKWIKDLSKATIKQTRR